MAGTPQLILFLKAPQIGAVKTRLAADIGRLAAWRFYRSETEKLCRRLARDRRWRCWLAVTPDRFAGRDRFWPAGIPRQPQGVGDLGCRMARVMRALPRGPVVLIGGDIPTVGSAHIAQAFSALRRADVVFGPAADGGFWLVGLRHPARVGDLYRGVAWSTGRTLADTVANIHPLKRVRYIDKLEDIDDRATWRRWRGQA